MILSFINICKVLRELLKTTGFAVGFQYFPRDLANANEWNIIFDPSITCIYKPLSFHSCLSFIIECILPYSEKTCLLGVFSRSDTKHPA